MHPLKRLVFFNHGLDNRFLFNPSRPYPNVCLVLWEKLYAANLGLEPRLYLIRGDYHSLVRIKKFFLLCAYYAKRESDLTIYGVSFYFHG